MLHAGSFSLEPPHSHSHPHARRSRFDSVPGHFRRGCIVDRSTRLIGVQRQRKALSPGGSGSSTVTVSSSSGYEGTITFTCAVTMKYQRCRRSTELLRQRSSDTQCGHNHSDDCFDHHDHRREQQYNGFNQSSPTQRVEWFGNGNGVSC